MKSKIFCFSSTGNSLSTAKRIASGLKDCQVVPINKKTKHINFTGIEKIGFVFPVYAYGMPRTVQEFIANNEFKKDIYYFAVATCGGTPGGTLKKLEKQLEQKGCKLKAGFTVKAESHNLMEANFIMQIMIKIAGPQPKTFLKRSEKIMETVQNRQEQKIESSFGLANFFGNLIHAQALDQLKDNHSKLYLKNSCSGCNSCLQVCPRNNIKLRNGKPIWLEDCESCFGCLQWCPNQAIGYKGIDERGKRSKNRNISLNEMSNFQTEFNSNDERIG